MNSFIYLFYFCETTDDNYYRETFEKAVEKVVDYLLP